MESIIRSVKDIEGDKRSALESVLGKKLQDNQQLLIRVITVGTEPSTDTRDAALDQAGAIARQGRAHSSAEGITPEEADTAIDETIRELREQQT